MYSLSPFRIVIGSSSNRDAYHAKMASDFPPRLRPVTAASINLSSVIPRRNSSCLGFGRNMDKALHDCSPSMTRICSIIGETGTPIVFGSRSSDIGRTLLSKL